MSTVPEQIFSVQVPRYNALVVPPTVQVISAHPVAARYLVHILSSDRALRQLLATPPAVDVSSLPKGVADCVFIVDTYFLSIELSKIMRILRVRCLESRFVALVNPARCVEAYMLQLLYLGVDGVVKFSDELEAELPNAVQSILGGRWWMPPQVIRQYKHQTDRIRSQQFRSRFLLTFREEQVLEMLIRRFSNKEVAEALGISKRTVKFHVSNILTKLRAKDRASLSTVLKKRLAGNFA